MDRQNYIRGSTPQTLHERIGTDHQLSAEIAQRRRVTPSTPQLEQALRYAAIGWPIFPCGKGDDQKEPLTGDEVNPETGKGGFHVATTDEGKIREWWRMHPKAHVAVACGAARLVVIDLDYDPTKQKDGPSVWKMLCETNGRDLCGLIAQTPRGGRHLFYQMPEGQTVRSRIDLAPGIDVRADGGYVLLPAPSSSGREWCAGDPFDVDADGVGDCGPMPQWVKDLLGTSSERRTSSSAGGESGRAIPLDDAAVRSIQSALAAIDSDPHDDWLHVGMALRSTSARDQAYDIWCEWSQTSPKFNPKDQRRRWNSFKEFFDDGSEITIATLYHLAKKKGWQPSMQQELEIELEQSIAPVVAAESSESEPPAAVLPTESSDSEPPKSSTTNTRRAFPAHLLEVPGLLGAVVQWMLANSPRRQPALCLGSTITTLGALLGRRVQTTTGLRTNVYALGIAETAAGKNAGIELPADLLTSAGLQAIVGPSEWKSDSGIRSSLLDESTRSHVSLVDEFTKFLAAVSGRTAAGHQLGIKRSLLELFSRAGKTWLPAAYADRKLNPATPIEEPHLCFYGTGVPSELFASMDRGAVSDGFLPRLLVFFSDDQMPARQKFRNAPPPPELVARVRALEEQTRRVGDLYGVCRTVEFDAAAEAAWDQIQDDNDDRFRRMQKSANPALADLWVRFGEHIAKLALIRSVSIDPTKAIDEADIRWAEELVEWCIERLVAEAADRIADSEVEAATQRVWRLVRDAGPDGLSLNELTRRTKWLRRSERKDVLASLAEGHEIVIETQASGSNGGRPKTMVRAI